MQSRRRFLQSTFACATAFPLPLLAAGGSVPPLRIGLITDVHKDVIHDAHERLKTFVDAMNMEKVDAIFELGDFCIPKPANRAFADILNGFAGPKYHVIGNHDTDGGFRREQVVAFHAMAGRYYSFDLGGFHFIMLDANDRPQGWKGGYPHFIAADQVDWLRQDLGKTMLPTFILSHQSLEMPTCIDNQAEIRAILEAAKMPDGRRKVAGCFNGHWHLDHQRLIADIPYLHINSASYYWLGSDYKREVLDPELGKKFPWVASTAPYTRPLFTILEINPAAGIFSIHGSTSEWLGPSPEERNYQSPEVENHWISPTIKAVRQKLA